METIFDKETIKRIKIKQHNNRNLYRILRPDVQVIHITMS